MRLTTGSRAPDFSAESIGGRRVSLEQLRGRPLLLKFYRFATCPVCNLHMHKFIQEHQMVSDAGLTTVVFYHSPADKLAEAQDYATPFDLVADPGKKIFTAYGVERGLRGLVSPTVMRDYAKALMAGYSPGLLTSDGGITGNPADFIIDASGHVVYAKYGKHYADSLDAPEVVQAWRDAQRNTGRPQMERRVVAATASVWTQGDDVIIAGSVNNEEAKKIYPDGWNEPKPYIRIVSQPGFVKTFAEDTVPAHA